MKKLYLASQSVSRQQLLKEALIPFQLLAQSADETACDWSMPLEQVVRAISLYKMEHVVLPKGKEGDEIFVLTADTLSQDVDGQIEGKPLDRDDAIRKIRKARLGTQLYTSFCLDKKKYTNGKWQVSTRIHTAVGARYIFNVSDEWLERYLDNSIGLSASNAIAVELYGSQFLKEVSGSYTAIVGLPMYEIREALSELRFFS